LSPPQSFGNEEDSTLLPVKNKKSGCLSRKGRRKERQRICCMLYVNFGVNPNLDKQPVYMNGAKAGIRRRLQSSEALRLR
tara:strand:- start:104 stop:343 length:240 start_codon:yes stop_codon:yes gene_type:complete